MNEELKSARSPVQAAVSGIERASVLDRVADPLTAAVRSALPAGPLKDGLSGTWLGHTLHPLLTDVPIGAWTSSLILDAVGGPQSRTAADRLIAIGILAALPTAATGIADWGDTQPKKRRVGLVHAAANTTALALFSGSLRARRRGRRACGIAFSLAGAGALGVGGYLGGHLVLAHGLGVDRTTFASPPEDWTDATAENDVAKGQLTHARVDGVGAVLTRHQGEVVALADRCTHRGAPLHEGKLRDGAIVCPWHQSIFRLADGSIVQGPATRAVLCGADARWPRRAARAKAMRTGLTSMTNGKPDERPGDHESGVPRTNARGGRHRVVVVGGGFGGLQAVRSLRGGPVEIALIDRRNFHLFQPLLYQAATGALAPEEIAASLRVILKRHPNVHVLMGEVQRFDLDARRVIVDRLPEGDPEVSFPYDTLIVAGGSRYSYFGHDEWRPFAHEIKSLESAVAVRQRLFAAFEAAELELNPKLREAWLTFVVVGGGPTGVEMAGQIAELAHDTAALGFQLAEPRRARILLMEASDRLLSTFPPRLSTKAARALERLGVTPMLDTAVIDLDEHSVSARRPDGKTEQIPTRTIVWSAGVVASELATASGAELDRGGRVDVGPDLTIQGHPEVFALGDMVSVHDAAGNDVALPGLASTAMQQGRYVAASVRSRAEGRSLGPFRFVDKGNLTTIGRARAVAEIKGDPDQRSAGLADLARRPHLLSDRPPEPPARPHPLGV